MIYKSHDLCEELGVVNMTQSSVLLLLCFFSPEIEKMVELQMLIDHLKLKLEKFTDVKALDFLSAYEDEPAVMAFARRPYSVPLTKNLTLGTEIQKVRSTQIFFLLLCNDYRPMIRYDMITHGGFLRCCCLTSH